MVEMSPFTRFLKVFEKSEVIFEENSLGNDMYVIHSGKVKLSTKAPGREVVLAILGPGEFFGEMALVDAAPRTAAAIAEEDDTRLIVLDQGKFLYLVSQQPAFALTIMHALCKRVRERWALYSGLFEKSTPPLPPSLQRGEGQSEGNNKGNAR
ncbi:MAG: cyclic nucleotide-binding domain-containing protein [Thermodesulfobacteriota bacterium]